SAYMPAQRVFRPNFDNGPRNVDIGLLAIPYGPFNRDYNSRVVRLVTASAFFNFSDIGYGARADLVNKGYQVQNQFGTERYVNDKIGTFSTTFSTSAGYQYDAAQWYVTGPNAANAIPGTGAVALGDSGSPLFSAMDVPDPTTHLSYLTNDEFAVASNIAVPSGPGNG